MEVETNGDMARTIKRQHEALTSCNDALRAVRETLREYGSDQE